MIQISYTVSPFLTRFLDRAEVARKAIILSPLSQRREIELQFESTIQRIDLSLQLIHKSVPDKTIRTILSNQIAFAMQKSPKKNNPEQQFILGYKHAFDLIRRNWHLNPESVLPKHIKSLCNEFVLHECALTEKQVRITIETVQSTSDNPYIQTAIAKLLFRDLFKDEPHGETFSTLCAYLFLYKGGIEARGAAILEQAWIQDTKLFEGHYATALARGNLTSWIEYFVKSYALALEEIQQGIFRGHHPSDLGELSKLNERQKTIITLLDDPQAMITNRTVQKIFHISQITASRDLAKLTSLGLLIPQGKGRSVRYTRL